MGVLRRILDAAIPLRGQFVYVNGEQSRSSISTCPPTCRSASSRCRSTTPSGPARAARHRGVPSSAASARRLRAGRRRRHRQLAGERRRAEVRARYLVGADGAHSVVRKALGLTFEGAAFDEEYMLGDVEVDWSLPRGYGDPGDAPDRRHDRRPAGLHPAARAAALPDVDARARRAATPAPADGIAHGFEGARKPELHHIQAVLDRLSPEPTTARTCAGPRCSGSATASSTPTAGAGCSSRATPRTSTRRPARRA